MTHPVDDVGKGSIMVGSPEVLGLSIQTCPLSTPPLRNTKPSGVVPPQSSVASRAITGSNSMQELPENGNLAKIELDQSILPSIGLEGTSGHSRLRKLRFAFGSYAPSLSMLVMYFSKDVYILKLGANAARVAVIATAWSLAFPFMHPFVGHLLDREPPLLDLPGWGRRAPWFMSHLLPLSVAVGLIYVPGLVWLPDSGSFVLDFWLAICVLISAWCLAVLLNVFESSRAEIYPFKEERVFVEALVKFVAVGAAASGVVPQLVVMSVPTFPARVGASCFLFLAVLVSLQTVPVLWDAQQPRNREKKASFKEVLQVVKAQPMIHASAARFWHSAADTTSLNFSIYYITFVDMLDSVECAKWLFLSLMIVGFLEFVILTPLFGYVWTKSALKRKLPWVHLMEGIPFYAGYLHSFSLPWRIIASIATSTSGVLPWFPTPMGVGGI